MFTATPVVATAHLSGVAVNAKTINPRGSGGFPMEGNS